MSTTPTPFAAAIEQFILETQRKEDKNSVFYREVLSKVNSGQFRRDVPDESRKWADELAKYVDNLDQCNRKDSLLRKSTEKLGPVVSGFNQYIGACDVLIQAGPAAAILLYGGVRVVLQLVQRVHDCYGAIVSMLEDIRHQVQAFNLFSTAFAASDEVKEHLVRSYKLIIAFWLRASRLLSSRSPKTIFSRNSLLSREWQAHCAALTRCCKTVEMMTRGAEAEIRRERDELNEARYSEEQRKKNAQSIAEWIKAGEEDEKLRFRTMVREKASTRHGNSCQWVLSQSTFQAWLGAHKSSTIWLYGYPGTGKSVLVSYLIQHLETQETSGKSLKTISYFFQFNDPTRKKAITALRSIASQLLSMYASIPDVVKDLHSADVTQHITKLEDLDCLVQVIAALVKQVSRVHIVIDGVDECEDRDLLLRLLRQLSLAPTYGIVKWLFTSRAEKDIETSLSAYISHRIEISPEKTHEDVRSFMTERLRAEPCSKCDHCVDLWISKAEGNFLWADVTLRLMAGEGFTCEGEVEESLSKFPTGLQGCYARSLQHLVRTRTKAEVELARKVFVLVAGARQPLRLSEVEHALMALRNAELSRSVPASDYDEKWRPRSGVVQDLCSALIVFEQTQTEPRLDPLLKFSHKSVHDFFYQNAEELEIFPEIKGFFTSKEAANLLLSEACLRYLSFVRYEKPQDVRNMLAKESHAFLAHAAAFWYDYWNRIALPPSRQQLERILQFIKSASFWNCVATQAHVVPHQFACFFQTSPSCFRLQASHDGAPEDPRRVHYSSPLPSWLDDRDSSLDGHHAIEAFQDFIKQWHPVLNSSPQAITQCIMPRDWYSTFSYRKRWRSKRVRIWELPQTSISAPSPGNTTIQSIRNVKLRSWTADIAVVPPKTVLGNGYHALNTIECSNDDKKAQRTVNEAKPTANSDIDSPMQHQAPPLYDSLQSFNGSLQHEDFCIEVLDNLASAKILPLTKKHFAHSGAASSDAWDLIRYSIMATQAGSGMVAAAFCVSETSLEATTRRQMIVNDNSLHSEEESYEASEGDADSDSNFDPEENHGVASGSDNDREETSGSGSESDADSTNQTSVDGDITLETASTENSNRCIMISAPCRPPMFSFWTSRNFFEEMSFAKSQSRKLAIWSQRLAEASIVDLDSKILMPVTVYLPEPKRLLTNPGFKATRKEFHFSEQSCEVYYLALSANHSAFGTEKSLTITPLTLSWSSGGPSLDLSGRECTITYCAAGVFRSPAILTAWTSGYFYAALPQASCDTKVVRLRLSELDGTSEPYFETLEEPVYFPASVLDRSPKLYFFDRENDKQSLILTLDAQHALDSQEVLQPPLVMEWTIQCKSDWRKWDDTLDSESEQYKTASDAYSRLRGTFVDANQRFNVPIRSGLDWTRKAFVSCN